MRYSVDYVDDYETLHVRLNRLLGAVLTILVMLVLKRFYSVATADQLTWMLTPTAWLTDRLSAADLVWESAVGYVDFDLGIIIAPSCAGINFLIMAFGMAAFCGWGHLYGLSRDNFSKCSLSGGSLSRVLAYLAFCLFSAFLLAVAVNTLRVVLSIRLYHADIHTDWWTPARVHRLAGVLIYLSALGLFFKGLRLIIKHYYRRFDHQGRSDILWPSWLPLVWYLLGTVGVPAANLFFNRPQAAFAEHCGMVTLVTAAVFMLGCAGCGIRRLITNIALEAEQASKNNCRKGDSL